MRETKKWGLLVAAGVLAMSGYMAKDRSSVASEPWGQTTLDQLEKREWITKEATGPTQHAQQATRAEAAVLLGKALGLKPAENTAFKDVSGEAAGYLDELVTLGIFQAGKQFNPNDHLTRGQAAKIVVEAFKLNGSKSTAFTDVTGWEKPYVETLLLHEITTGKTPTAFAPKDSLTRMQLYAFVNRAFEKQELTHQTTVVKKAFVTNESQWKKLLDETYRELPDKVEIQTSLKKSQLAEWLGEWERQTHPKDNLNRHTLASYHLLQKGQSLYLEDRSHDTLSAKQVQEGVQHFASEWASTMVDSTDSQKAKGIYDYLYENYTYEAKGYKQMMVGNMWSDTLACNGFSRLAYEMATAAGMEAHIVMGEEHLWNVLVIDGEHVLFDATSDIYMQRPFWTLGLSSQEHRKALQEIPFYSGNFDYGRYPSLSNKSQVAEMVKNSTFSTPIE